MKPGLTVLLGAGSTVSLDPSVNGLRGIPSTEDLTALISRLTFPRIVLSGTPFFLSTEDKNPFLVSETIPAAQLLFRALSNKFSTVNFELILYAIEQLLPFASMRAGAKLSNQFHPAIAAFVEILRQYEVLNDWSLLRATRESVISAIHSAILNRTIGLKNDLPLHRLINSLAEEFRVAVFTLNYDDVVDAARSAWLDGFVGPDEAKSFDATAFELWRDSDDPILVHLHGSVRFGPSRNGFDLVKYRNATEAGEAMKGVSRSDKSTGGQIVSSDPLISGLNKAARLTLNPIPYGYYYKALIDSLLSTERLLVIGYGAKDEHVNTWVEQFAAKHRERRRVGWVGMLDGKVVGDPTMEKKMINLLSGNRFEDFRHNNASENPASLMECGDNLRLVAAGFPLSSETQSEIISFLRLNSS